METETIVQISTPLGNSVRGIVRISGPEALAILSACIQPDIENSSKTYFSADTYFKWDDEVSLPVRVYVMRAPYSYTREDVAEIHAPGRLSLLQELMARCVEKGARPACPGEFTKRAFLNGRINLSQAESVMRIIHAKSVRDLKYSTSIVSSRFSGFLEDVYERLKATKAATTLAIDFEEPSQDVDREQIVAILSDIQQAICRQVDLLRSAPVRSEEMNVVLAGPANAGKSSLFNRISGSESAIIDKAPGTTRDVNRKRVAVDDLEFNLLDTAGLKRVSNDIDTRAVSKTSAFSAISDLILCVFDGTAAVDSENLVLWDNIPVGPERIYVINKSDKQTVLSEPMLRKIFQIPSGRNVFHTSAVTGKGIPQLTSAICNSLFLADNSFNPLDTKLRNAELLNNASETLDAALSAASNPNTPLEILDSILNNTLILLADLTGKNITEDVLNDIFSRFCIGK